MATKAKQTHPAADVPFTPEMVEAFANPAPATVAACQALRMAFVRHGHDPVDVLMRLGLIGATDLASFVGVSIANALSRDSTTARIAEMEAKVARIARRARAKRSGGRRKEAAVVRR